MADFVRLLDSVRVATTTTGTGAYSVGAAPVGYIDPFLSGAISGQRYTWRCESEDGATWEVFEGVLTSGSPATISRNRIIRNSSGGTTAINWPAGTKRITCVAVADRLPYFDTDGNLSFPIDRYLGLGVSPDAPLTIQAKPDAVAQKIRGRAADGAAVIQFVTADNAQERARIQSNATGGLLIATGASANPAFLADAAQNIMLGKVTLNAALPGLQFTPSSNLALLTSAGPGLGVRRNDTDGTLAVFYRNDTVSGTISCAGATVAYNTTSDGRLKDVEREIDGVEAEDVIRRLRPVSYRWRHDPEAGLFAGFIAQDFGEVLPRGVTPGQGEPGDEDFMPMGMSADVTIPYLVALANRTLDRLAAAEAEIAALKAAAG